MLCKAKYFLQSYYFLLLIILSVNNSFGVTIDVTMGIQSSLDVNMSAFSFKNHTFDYGIEIQGLHPVPAKPYSGSGNAEYAFNIESNDMQMSNMLDMILGINGGFRVNETIIIEILNDRSLLKETGKVVRLNDKELEQRKNSLSYSRNALYLSISFVPKLTGSIFSPYVNGAFGYAKINADFSKHDINEPTVMLKQKVDDSGHISYDTVESKLHYGQLISIINPKNTTLSKAYIPAFSIGTGVNISLNEMLDLSIGYKFSALSDKIFLKNENKNIENLQLKGDMLQHSLNIALRMTRNIAK